MDVLCAVVLVPTTIDCLLIPHTAGIRKLLRSPRSIAGRLPLTRRSVVALLGAVVCSLRTPQTAAHPCRTPQTRCPRPCFAPPRARRSRRSAPLTAHARLWKRSLVGTGKRTGAGCANGSGGGGVGSGRVGIVVELAGVLGWLGVEWHSTPRV
jgi:hypothetical protein